MVTAGITDEAPADPVSSQGQHGLGRHLDFPAPSQGPAQQVDTAPEDPRDLKWHQLPPWGTDIPATEVG